MKIKKKLINTIFHLLMYYFTILEAHLNEQNQCKLETYEFNLSKSPHVIEAFTKKKTMERYLEIFSEPENH